MVIVRRENRRSPEPLVSENLKQLVQWREERAE